MKIYKTFETWLESQSGRINIANVFTKDRMLEAWNAGHIAATMTEREYKNSEQVIVPENVRVEAVRQLGEIAQAASFPSQIPNRDVPHTYQDIVNTLTKLANGEKP